MVCCLPTCAQGSSAAVTGSVGSGAFWAVWVLLGVSFSRFWVFLCSRNSSFWWGGLLVRHLWIGRARHPGPGSAGFVVEVFNVGGWLTHRDFVLDTEVDVWLLWSIG